MHFQAVVDGRRPTRSTHRVTDWVRCFAMEQVPAEVAVVVADPEAAVPAAAQVAAQVAVGLPRDQSAGHLSVVILAPVARVMEVFRFLGSDSPRHPKGADNRLCRHLVPIRATAEISIPQGRNELDATEDVC